MVVGNVMPDSRDSDRATAGDAFVAVYQGARLREMYKLTRGGEITVGRDESCQIMLADEVCSRRHGAFVWKDSAWWLHDLGSRNGTLVNGQRLSQPQVLQEGDLIQIGKTKLRFTWELIESSQVETRESARPTLDSPQDESSDDEGGGPLPLILDRRSRVGLFTESSLTSEGLWDARVRRGFARLYELSGPMLTATSVEELAGLVLDGLLPAVSADVGAVLLFPEGTADRLNPDRLVTIVSRSPPDLPAPQASRTVSRRVLREGEAILAMNIEHDPNRAKLGTVREMRSVICAPIRGSGENLGLLHVYCSRSGQSLDFISLEIVLAVADQLGRTLESLRQKASLQAGLQGEREVSRALRRLLETEGALVGGSPAMSELRHKLARLAASDATVLVRGESGVGKELACRELHFQSSRRNGPFVCLNCAAIPETLLESELFGHEKGAFTGATGQKIGKFELSDGGTLFLDEVGELPLSLQARFLRVLEGHPFERVGGNTSIRPNTRIVAATNRDLETAVEAGQFRQDLFYRLQVLEVRVPPLREHVEDVPELAGHFLTRACQRLGRPPLCLSPEALRALAEYSWPGNVRELRSVMERAAILSDRRELRPDDLQLGSMLAQAAAAEGRVPPPYEAILLEEVERRHILQTLRATNWVKREAARVLGINRSTLDRKLERYGLADEASAPPE
mgnify:CR=1 FL=1